MTELSAVPPSDFTALVVPFAELEAVVGPWRARFDAVVANVPPHVTVLTPWITPSELRTADLDAVGQLAKDWTKFEVTFAGFEMFDVADGPDVHFLAPVPAAQFGWMTEDVMTVWPEHEPYGGVHGNEPVPHLTVSSTGPDDELPPMFAAVNAKLPITVLAREISVLEVRAGVATTKATFRLSGK